MTDTRSDAGSNPERFVSASELGEYAYCRRAWWLRVVRGATSTKQGTRFQAGHLAHEAYGTRLRLARLAVIAGRVALAAAALIALAALVLWWKSLQ